MKKLKLKKETISILAIENQKNIVGGVGTGRITCRNYTVQTVCANTQHEDCNSNYRVCTNANICA